jgi:hypothetical protein
MREVFIRIVLSKDRLDGIVTNIRDFMFRIGKFLDRFVCPQTIALFPT